MRIKKIVRCEVWHIVTINRPKEITCNLDKTSRYPTSEDSTLPIVIRCQKMVLKVLRAAPTVPSTALGVCPSNRSAVPRRSKKSRSATLNTGITQTHS